MIEKTDFGDVIGGTVAGCNCAGQCQSCSCNCTWWIGDHDAANFNTGFAENLNTSYWIKEHP